MTDRVLAPRDAASLHSHGGCAMAIGEAAADALDGTMILLDADHFEPDVPVREPSGHPH